MSVHSDSRIVYVTTKWCFGVRRQIKQVIAGIRWCSKHDIGCLELRVIRSGKAGDVSGVRADKAGIM